MEISPHIPIELVPVFRVYRESLKGLTLREALLFFMKEFPTEDPEHLYLFTVSEGWRGNRTLTMSIGARIRLLFGILQSRPIMLRFSVEALLDHPDTLQPVHETDWDSSD